jgi:murein DD-endopeptidase MepM/ murein hydrolase activator NlpD
MRRAEIKRVMMRYATLSALIYATCGATQQTNAKETEPAIEQELPPATKPAPTAALIGPVFNKIFTCIEHYAGQLPSLGDALGTDCHIQAMVEVDGRMWPRSYQGDGTQNADWYGWKQDVLAPITGTISKVNINPVENLPGVMGQGTASFVIISSADGVKVLLAHVDEVRVKEGDTVSAGQVIAKVGNNGQSRHPHIHIGAWKDTQPLQVRFDQAALRAAYHPSDP